MKVIVVPIIIGALRSIPKNFAKRLQESDTIHSTAFLKSVRIVRQVQGDLMSHDLHRKLLITIGNKIINNKITNITAFENLAFQKH